jgi:hypothetical protein
MNGMAEIESAAMTQTIGKSPRWLSVSRTGYLALTSAAAMPLRFVTPFA